MIEIDGLRMEFTGFALRNINLLVGNEEFFTLLGPTGAGKTLILEAIAGVSPIHGGSIRLDGRDVTRLPPEERGVGIVYQDYALFPHLSVKENVVYGLRYRRKDLGDASDWVDWLMERLGIRSLANRSPLTLSGGEKQRVTLARALAVRPSVLLLDEPLSALDPNFREEIRELLKKLHKELRISFLMVTHDFAEALFLSERAAIINRGRIEQFGPVSEVFRKPSSPFVAEFVGMKNVFRADFNGARAMLGGLELRLSRSPVGHKEYIAIRPEDVLIGMESSSIDDPNAFHGELCERIDRGLYHEVSIRKESLIFKAVLTKRDFFALDLQERADVGVTIDPSAIHVF